MTAVSALIARHPFAFGLAVFIAANVWPVHCALVGLAIVAVLVGRQALAQSQARWRWQAAQHRALARRADYEHRLALAGDPRGTFGQFPRYPTTQRTQRM